MHMFYEPELAEDMLVLSPGESHHCVKVLRMKEGDQLLITNGRGMLCKSRLAKADPKSCLVETTDVRYNYGKRPYTLHIAMAPTKSVDRFEWFLEKAVECGIDIITPLLCEYSERKVIKPVRLERQIIAAMKQSCRAYLPELKPLTKFSDFINNISEKTRFIAHCGEDKSQRFIDVYTKGANVVIAIGPEGGFSNEEIHLAKSNRFNAISLGKHRLRTETAGIAACVQANAVNGLL